MEVDFITKNDLQIFRRELLDDMTKLLMSSRTERREWLKSNEVRKILKISSGTLQNLRISRKLQPSKIGGILYYRYIDLEKLLDGNK
jgi:Helix-turn-helix domain